MRGIRAARRAVHLLAVLSTASCVPAPRSAPAPVAPLDAVARPGTRVLVFARDAPVLIGGRVVQPAPNAVHATGVEAIRRLGERHGFTVEQTTDRAVFTDEQLARFAAVVFLASPGTALLTEQKLAFQRYIRGGGGFAGVGFGGDGNQWPWFEELVGADFRRQAAAPGDLAITRADSTHLSMRGVPTGWVLRDSWFEYRPLAPDLRILATLDGAQRPEPDPWSDDREPFPSYPVSWYHTFEGGRAWYTALGRDDIGAYSDPGFLNHVAGGILWAAGH